MPESNLQEPDLFALRLFARAQRIFGRIDDLPAFLDLLAETIVKMLEEVDPVHAAAPHVLGAAGLLSRDPHRGVFRPLRLKGRPDPSELRSFVEHVGPGDSEHPTGLMGWSAARRKVAVRHGEDWLVAERSDEQDRWGALRPATRAEAEEMEHAAIAAYPSLRSQLAVPILDPEMRGQARPRHTIGILNVESDELLSDRFCQFMIAFTNSIGNPLMAALRMRDIGRLARRLGLPLSRATLGTSLLDVTLPYLPPRERRGLVALRDFAYEDRFVAEAMVGGGLDHASLQDFANRRLAFGSSDGLWGQAIRTRLVQYMPDVPRRPHGVHRPFWHDSQCALVIPLLTGDGRDCLGLLALESGETSYAFSTQDQGFFQTAAALAAVAVTAIRDPRLAYSQAVRVPALLQRMRRERLDEIPEDQIVRINAICRALIKHNFVFQRAAEETRLTVHVLREYTSRSPRIIDVDELRTQAARQEELLHVAARLEAEELQETR